jgi:SAM-dependent methyltransferase
LSVLEQSRRLNLGCGQFRKEGFLNVDADPSAEPDVLVDLDLFPYPFEDRAFELIEADHVLEHLADPFAVMAELHRILQPGGILVIRVPHFSRGMTHADHKRGFDVTFPHYFNRAFKGGYVGIDFTLERMRLTWFAQPYLKRTVLSPTTFRIAAFAGGVFDALARLSPYLCSRLWCYWVGGFEQLEFVFRRS